MRWRSQWVPNALRRLGGVTTDAAPFPPLDPDQLRQLPIRLFAPAKLTMSLRVTGVRPDGMHEIDAEMVSLDFGDDLELSQGAGVELYGPAASAQLQSIEPGTDLVSLALKLAGMQAAVRIHKRIPAGAGLGGGSSDAAAILRWAGMTDPVRAATIGADVAFCLLGGRARVHGIGERIDQLEPIARTVTLLTPPIHASTPAVYRCWDEMGGPAGDNGNDLEAAAIRCYPELARYRDELGEMTGANPRLAGSGSTWFVEGAFPGSGRVVAHTL